MDIKQYFKRKAELVERELDRLLPAEHETPQTIHQAMRYSVFAGGKRLRPILAIAAGEIFGADERELLPAASALEMIHTYSLIHDDLPAMDNDDLRRGLPTCHVKFGEAMAILAGDALLTQAFVTLADCETSRPERKARVISEVAQAAATRNALIGKTGAIIRCSIRIGAIIGGASEAELNALTVYGEKAGLAFQVADDLLDETATSEELGKTAGKDAASHKATYPALYGINGAREMAERWCREAIDAARSIERETEALESIARFIVERRS